MLQEMAKNGESVPYISKQNGVSFFFGRLQYIYIYVYMSYHVSSLKGSLKLLFFNQ